MPLNYLTFKILKLKTFEQTDAIRITFSGLFIDLVSAPPRLLGLIHGDIGILQECTFIYSILGIESDTDTRRH